jgi:uncharacterized hydrophobic protein (TIGR00271 family)
MFSLRLFRRPTQSLTEATPEEIKEAIELLILLSTNDYGYYLFLILSILISTAGLLLNSVPVIIGGMIIAPIIMPLLSCGLAILLLEGKGFMRAMAITLLSSVVAIGLSAAMTMFTLIVEPEGVVAKFTSVEIAPGLYFIIAFSSGIAGAYAFVKKHLSASISGVAVSASLVPPLCAVGIGVALSDDRLMETAFFIFALNVAGIIVASSFVFWILGFRSARSFEERAVENAEKG